MKSFGSPKLINFADKEFCTRKRSKNEELISSKNNTIINKSSSSGSRPKDTAVINKHHYRETHTAAKSEIASLYYRSKTFKMPDDCPLLLTYHPISSKIVSNLFYSVPEGVSLS